MENETGSEPKCAKGKPGLANAPVNTGNSRAEDKLEKIVVDEAFRKRVETVIQGLTTLPKNWDELTIREQRDWIYGELERKLTNLPKSLIFLCVGSMMADECERPEDEPCPEWLDREKFLRGQRFAMDNLAGIFFAEMLSLFALFSFENGLKPLILTGKSSEPYTSFKRYLSTGRRVRSWYASDPWTKDTPAYSDIRTVKKMHSIVRQKLTRSSLEEIDETSRIAEPWNPTSIKLLADIRDSCRVPLPGQCPYAYPAEEKHKRPKALNQGELAATQFGFFGLVILFPERFGIHNATDDDLDAFCHVWRGLGYLLGIEDEFNFCSGSLEDVKQRSRDFLEYWVKPNLREITPEWEHMLRCVIEGIQYYFPTANYEQSVLYLTELLEIPMPRLRASLSYYSWIRYFLMKRTFSWTIKYPGVREMMNRGLNKSLDRAVNFGEKQLEALQKRSSSTMSKGIAETVAVNRHCELAASTYSNKTTFLAYLSTCFLHKFPAFVKEIAKRLFGIDFGSSVS